MRKLLVTMLATIAISLPVIAAEETPNQEVVNTKSYTGINYNRQDLNKASIQKITNDHSWFNSNIQIIKKGALFQTKEKKEK